MVRANPERGKRIYEMWRLSETIDEISLATAIPRSTVGYYVRKFNRDEGKHRLRLGEGLEDKPRSIQGLLKIQRKTARAYPILLSLLL